MNPVKRLRLQTRKTQEELAAAAKTSQPTVAAYEAGLKSPTLDTLRKIARSVGLDVAISFVSPMTREDLRSLAYHELIIKKLREKPEPLLAKARANLMVMTKLHSGPGRLFRLWEQWLDLPLDQLINLCLDTNLLARDMRQVTPFAGILTARERLDVIKRFRKERAQERKIKSRQRSIARKASCR